MGSLLNPFKSLKSFGKRYFMPPLGFQPRMGPPADGIQDAATGMADPDDADPSFQARRQDYGRKEITPAHQEPDEGQGWRQAAILLGKLTWCEEKRF
jgi:hypothetical protein